MEKLEMSGTRNSDFVAPTYISLKNDPERDEGWLHGLLANSPSLLGLGDLEARDSERRQPSGGRLDLLLQDVENGVRYEVEIQLGAMDESHIIRTIEYWDIERRRYPQYEHIAVIVAEDVTSRFLNVISLLNGAIPLIAIKIACVEINGAYTIVATRVIDLTTWGTDEEDIGGVRADREYWEQLYPRKSIAIFDRLVEMVQEAEPSLGPKYNKNYIGLATSTGKVWNFVVFKPKKGHVIIEIKIPQDEQQIARYKKIGLEIGQYNSRYAYYPVNVYETDIQDNQDSLRELIHLARSAHMRG
jgi:hypothetical protein